MTCEPSSLGVWETVSPIRAAGLLSSVRVPWWVAGGWALDLFLGADGRPHQDLDIGILRRDLQEVLGVLGAWEVFTAKDGALKPLKTGTCPRHDVHSLWCRPNATAPWMLELMLDESEDDTWLFRQRHRFAGPCPRSFGYVHSEFRISLLRFSCSTRPKGCVNVTRPTSTERYRGWMSISETG